MTINKGLYDLSFSLFFHPLQLLMYGLNALLVSLAHNLFVLALFAQQKKGSNNKNCYLWLPPLPFFIFRSLRILKFLFKKIPHHLTIAVVSLAGLFLGDH